MSGSRRSWAGLAPGELTRLTNVWNEGVDRWAALSTESATLFVEDTGHHIQLDQPDLVIEQLRALLPSSS
jgi:pimeloyl-ACP methyl ester carboxylesterase